MSESEKSESKAPLEADATSTDKRPYTPPSILWREPYEPVTFGMSCAKDTGNPGCTSGPFTT
jgi:hypothetical protein